MGFDAICAVRETAHKDQFEIGSVVRWTSAGRYKYAALKSDAGWFTTATITNPFVGQKITFEELLDILARPESSEVYVCEDDWTEVE